MEFLDKNGLGHYDERAVARLTETVDAETARAKK
jgi:hypothetical protein